MMTILSLDALDTVCGGQDAGTTPAPAPEQPNPHLTLLGTNIADGISAAKCSNLDWAAQITGTTPQLGGQLQGAADKCWSDLRQGMLNQSLGQ